MLRRLSLCFTLLACALALHPRARADIKLWPGPQQGEARMWRTSSPDTFSYTPFAPTYRERLKSWCQFSAKNGKGLMNSVTRLTQGLPPMLDEEGLKREIARIYTREDTVDFAMTRLMLALYTDKKFGRKLFTPAQRALAEKTVLDFKYWITEPGPDTMITWTENHMILFHALEYLAGQYFPDKKFTNNGQTGRWRMAHARPYILRWINLRARFGFSEWDSNVYYNEDLPAILNLALFAQDKDLRTRATMAVDLMFLDIAHDHFYGGYITSHGRTYPDHNKDQLAHSMATPYKVLFGLGQFVNTDHFTATPLCVGGYDLPPAIEAIGQDMTTPFWGREGQGVSMQEALGPLGFKPENIDDLVHLWAFGAYTEPQTILATLNAADRYNLWEHPFFVDAAKFGKAVKRDNRLSAMIRTTPIESMRTLLGSVNKVTFRTADYQLSSAQSYRPGEAANQHMVCQGAVKGGPVVMVNNPGALSDEERTPAYWGNDNRLPRTAQWRNVLVSIYKIGRKELLGERALYHYTHAWVPRAQYDEVVDDGPWTFARKGQAYVALYASQPKTWTTEGREKDREIVAPGENVTWVIHLGREAEDGSFADFRRAVAQAALTVSADHLSVRYQAPGVGLISFGWKEPFVVNGAAVPLSGFPHFDNPYVLKERDRLQLVVSKNGHTLELDFAKGTRVYHQ